MPSTSVVSVLRKTFGSKKLTPANTIYGQSICSDEINSSPNTLSDMLRTFFTHVFPLGGIGGAPFVGKTGFKAFSSHVPDSGNVFIVYGPHVGVSLEGEIGKCRRRGQNVDSTACGALVAAYNQCCACHQGNGEGLDMQQDWLRQQVAPCVEKVSKAPVPMAQLALEAFVIVHNKLQSIIDTDFGPGCLVLLGGVQINMPEGMEDHFLPLNFEIRARDQSAEDIIDEFCVKGLMAEVKRLPECGTPSAACSTDCTSDGTSGPDEQEDGFWI
jgi:hypothetical protein